MTTIILETHRHTFEPKVLEELTTFAKIHQYDDRIAFKEAWTTLIEDPEIHDLFTNESQRLQKQGYKGDVYDKMYKSARYYFSKKSKAEPSKEPKPERKPYETIDPQILQEMDEHIRGQMKSNAHVDTTNQTIICKMTPAQSFENYCETYKKTTILHEIQNHHAEDKVTSEHVNQVIAKLKKTYKNRFYVIRKKLQEA